MPMPVLRACVAFGFALAILMFASVAEAKTTPGDLRVVDSDDKTLAEQTQYTTTTKIKTDPKADCFGDGTGGSGDKVTVDGATALGLIADAGKSAGGVSPLSVTDSFDFGLGLCGIGKAVAPSTGFWYLKENHVGSQTGGDQTIVKKGDEILWYLIEDFNDPMPDELVLTAPAKAKAGDELSVKVVSYADDGTKTPAEGAEVTGADVLTDAKGKTTVAADADLVEMTATRDGSIASNEEVVCTLKATKCPAGYAETIGGTGGDDKIAAGKDAETILAGRGDDTITSDGSSAPDLVKCGAGEDKVTGYEETGVFVDCEHIR